MATPDVFNQLGSPALHSKILNSPRLNPSPKETQESLKRSFAKYLAGDNASSAVGKLFVPSKHLSYEEPTQVHTMEDIGFPSSNGVSPVAVSEPFRLFSEDAVDIMRSEILDPEVLEKYSYTSDIAPRQIRGYAPKYVYTPSIKYITHYSGMANSFSKLGSIQKPLLSSQK
jgi:hypothetical protein